MLIRRRRLVAPRPYRRRAGFFGWLAPVVALIVAVAPALGSLHRALVPHLVCEHGDLIELADDDQSTLADRELTDRGKHSAAIVGTTGAAGHGHDHCLLAGLARTASSPARDSTPVLVVPDSAGRDVPAHAAQFVLSILSFAPKTSPPGSLLVLHSA